MKNVHLIAYNNEILPTTFRGQMKKNVERQ